MKNGLMLAAVLSVAVGAQGTAQQISTRAAGMADAVTAVYDTADTLRTNPAGLGFLRGSHGFIGLDAGLSLSVRRTSETAARARSEKPRPRQSKTSIFLDELSS